LAAGAERLDPGTAGIADVVAEYGSRHEAACRRTRDDRLRHERLIDLVLHIEQKFSK